MIKKIERVARQEVFIFLGIIMVIATLGKLLGFYNISSDWFWFLAGIGLAIEGTISLINRKRFERKYKIIEKSDVIIN